MTLQRDLQGFTGAIRHYIVREVPLSEPNGETNQMKTGMNLIQLATELERQRNVKRDFVVDSSVMVMDDQTNIHLQGVGKFGITNHARRQLADKLNIPFQYFERLQGKYPELLAKNVNTIMVAEPKHRMVRTLDGNIRGLMSNSYRPLDNFELADAVLPELNKAGAQIESCDITETKMYIKARCPWLTRDLPVPAGLKMGVGHNWFIRRVEGAISISGSDVGAGMLSVAPGIFEEACTNLAVFRDSGYGKIHIGKKLGGEESLTEYLSDETKRLDDAVVWAKVRDVVKATMDGRALEVIVAKMEAARGQQITGNLPKVVEVFGKRHGLSEDERGGVLRHLINGGELSQYGMQWAVTRLASDAQTYDRASELERLGGQVIELAANDWQAIAEAA